MANRRSISRSKSWRRPTSTFTTPSASSSRSFPAGRSSGGHHARAAAQSALIYLDEPTKGLDPIVAKKIRAFLKQFVQQERKSLLLTSHVLSEVDELADRVALIHHGTVSAASTPDDLKAAVGAAESIEIEKAALPPATRARIERLDMVQFTQERNGHWIAFGVSDALLAQKPLSACCGGRRPRPFRHHTRILRMLSSTTLAIT
jgi:ABC-type glutathione transport system ATPase component